MSAKSQLTESDTVGRMIRPVAVSVALGAVLCVAVLLILSFVVSSRNIPQSMIDPMAIFAMSVGAFASGLCCAGIMRKNGLICGLICGLVFSVLVLACAFSMPENGFGLGALIKVMFILLSSMLGGVLGVNTRRRRK